MRMTISEVVEKLRDIDEAICNVNARIDHDCYDSLAEASELLQEYRDIFNSLIWSYEHRNEFDMEEV